MKLTLHFLFILAFLAINGCEVKKEKKPLTAPIAEIKPHQLTKHGHTRTDNYYWLKNREDSAVLEYLNSENAYTDSILKPTEHFQEELFNEITGRIKKTDETVPYFYNGYFYYRRTVGDNEYPFYCRKKQSLDAQEEILLDAPEMAKGLSFFNIATFAISTNNNLMAYSVDTVSRRLYTIRVKNLENGEIYPDVIQNVSGDITWANDNKTFFYTIKDTITLLPYKVYRHTLGTDAKNDVLVYEEKDNTFYTYCYKTKSNKYIIISNSSTLTSECKFVDADTPTAEFTTFEPRQRGLEYYIEHFEQNFYIKTNADSAVNFKIMKTPVAATAKKNWVELIPHRKEVFVESFEIFKNFLVVEERSDGLTKMCIRKWKDNSEHYLDFGEPTYSAWISVNTEFNTDELRFAYSSLTTPNSTFDYNMNTKEKKLKKQQEVVGDFEPENYKTERIWAIAPDGINVPISLVYRINMRDSIKGNPLYIEGYGSYGSSLDPYFSSVRLSLLDRGFVYAIAHVRGGQEMGYDWYEDGKLLKKKNTFTDFIACTEYLINQKYADKNMVFASGGSAGGLLMGAIMNMKPDLYTGVVANVPFVDVVTTMLDESIPLTTGEYDEWGNPNEKIYYDYMLSYSPYDNVASQNYPNTLVLTGLHDSQVQYWEPAKWVAKLRALKTDNNRLLLKTNMDFGHGGASGRFERLKEVALEYTFIFDLCGIKK